MQKKPLVEVLHNLEQEMLRLGYAEKSMQFYRRRWKQLLQFAQERNEIHYSEALGMAFLEKHFNILEKDHDHKLSQEDVRELRITRMIGDFQLHQTILRRYYKHKEILIDPYFVAIRDQFKSYCINKDYSKITTDHHVNQSAKFMDYLVSQGIKNCKVSDLASTY